MLPKHLGELDRDLVLASVVRQKMKLTCDSALYKVLSDHFNVKLCSDAGLTSASVSLIYWTSATPSATGVRL